MIGVEIEDGEIVRSTGKAKQERERERARERVKRFSLLVRTQESLLSGKRLRAKRESGGGCWET